MIRKLLVLLLASRRRRRRRRSPNPPLRRSGEFGRKTEGKRLRQTLKEKHTVADGMFRCTTSRGSSISRFPIRFSGAKCCSDRPFRRFRTTLRRRPAPSRTIRCTWFSRATTVRSSCVRSTAEHHRRDGGFPRAGRGGEAEHGRSHPAQLQDRGLEPGQHGRGGQRHGLFVADVEEMSPSRSTDFIRLSS